MNKHVENTHGFCCPKCGSTRAYFIKTRNLHECKDCSYQVSLTTGTVMHKIRTSLLAWFWAMKAAEAFTLKHVAPGSRVTTDGLNIYTVVAKSGYERERVIISENQEQALETFKWAHTIISK